MKTVVECISEFLSHCKYEKNLSQKTLKSYRIDLSQFLLFLSQENYPSEIENIDKGMLRSYFQTLSERKPKTIKRKVATTKAMFNFLEYEDTILVNPFRKMRLQIREPKRLPTVMNLTEVENIMKEAYGTKSVKKSTNHSLFERLRDIAVIELLFATGIRVSELCHLKRESVDVISGQIKVIGKGNKERIIQVNSASLKSITKYYIRFEDKIEHCGYFFVNRLGKRFSEQSVRFLVKKKAAGAGLAKRITPHVFRHSFATLLLEQDVDIKYIQHLLGHSSITTTQIYTHVNGEKQRKILQKHPRKRIRMNG